MSAFEQATPPSGADPVDAAAVETWRIRSGRPRFPVDLTTESFPAEDPAAEAAIDTTKGCFLGQESVAKTATFGHPTHLVRAFTVDGPAAVPTRSSQGTRPSGPSRAPPRSGSGRQQKEPR